LGQGAGKLSIVNVNGNAEPERMVSFVEAISGKKDPAKDEKDKKRKGAKVDDTTVAAEEIAAQIARLSRKPGVAVAGAVAEPAAHSTEKSAAAHAEHGGHAEH
jgi:hypothetical protein